MFYIKNSIISDILFVIYDNKQVIYHDITSSDNVK